MNRRDWMLTGTATGLVVGGLGWLVTRAITAPRNVQSIGMGDKFPTFSGKLISGHAMTIPEDLDGDLGLLIVTWDNEATGEMGQWRQELMETYGLLPGIQVYEVAMIDGVGPVMRAIYNRIMREELPAPEREHALLVYGDLRRLRRQLDIAVTAQPSASVFLVNGDGRYAWRAYGPPTAASLEELRRVLNEQGMWS